MTISPNPNKCYILNVEKYYDGTIAGGEESLAAVLDRALKNNPKQELILFRANPDDGITEVSDIKYKDSLTGYVNHFGIFNDAYGTIDGNSVYIDMAI